MLWLLETFNRGRLERQRQRLEAEKEREILMLEVENKSRELSNAAFNLIRKNEALQSLKDNLLDENEPRALLKLSEKLILIWKATTIGKFFSRIVQPGSR